MRDFRSLEQKYRQMVEDRMNRNTDLRRKVENVGRPKDDVRDAETSKLAKQAEIKTKIIDEEHVEEGYSFKKTESKKWEGVGFGSTPAYHELHADGKPTGITVGGTKAGSYFVKKDGKHVTSSSSMDFAKKAAVDHHKGVKEEVELDEANKKDNSPEHKAKVKALFSLVHNIANKPNTVKTVKKDSDDHEAWREKRAAALKGRHYHEEVEIEEAASDAAVPKDDIQTNSNSPDPAVTKDKKKKESSTSDVDAKKITGGKTEVDLKPSTDDTPEDTSKEDEKSKKATNQENKKIGAKGVKEETMTNKHFGLPESLIQTVNEVLKGNQHKIDANHNGKIDAQDFKILKGKKKVTEEDKSCGCKGKCQCSTNEEVEQIDEISKKTAMSAYQSASDIDDEHPKQDAIRRHIERKWGKEMGKHADAHAHVSNFGRGKSALSTDKLTAYPATKKAGERRITKSGTMNKQDQKYNASAIKNRLGKHTKPKLPEEVQLSDAELARIEEITKGFNQ